MKQKVNALKPFTKGELEDNLGGIPKNLKLIKRVRMHQGWWRLNVLNQIPGAHPIIEGETVCNAILNGETSGSNFLSTTIRKIAENTLKNRTLEDGGKIEASRLYNNLLSSQPLSFNFFAELENDKELGLQILQTWWKDVTKLNKVLFEYSPPKNYTEDGSAFDVAFDVQFGDKRGFIGLECKYTDTFSYKPQKSTIFYGDIGNKNHNTFLKVFNLRKETFKADYFDFVKSKDYNQLFRNQLMAESVLHNENHIFKTGLFCYEEDKSAIKTGHEFQSMLNDGKDAFKTITYKNFIEATQKLNLTWEQREWSMLLWARYCGMELSKEVYNQFIDEG